MSEFFNPTLPPAMTAILRETATLGFAMSSERRTGALLRTLAASRRGGRLLELGTGTGVATAWMLDGMDETSHLLTVDTDADSQEIARRHLGLDARLEIRRQDAIAVILELADASLDLIFADAWPGKFSHLDETLALLKPGGLYVIDDLLPSPNWDDGHAPFVDRLLESLAARKDLVLTPMDWCSGVVVATKR
jgi:predicted O-methyltransferase YrrM